MTNLTDYTRINHYLMTVREMSEETGESDDRIRKISKRYDWTPISEADRIRDMITANPGGIIEDIAEKAGCGAANVYKLARDMGIDLVSRKHAEAVAKLPASQGKPVYSLMHRAFNDTEPISPERKQKILQKNKRIKEAYNQSGSPFGLADRVWNKNLK